MRADARNSFSSKTFRLVALGALVVFPSACGGEGKEHIEPVPTKSAPEH